MQKCVNRIYCKVVVLLQLKNKCLEWFPENLEPTKLNVNGKTQRSKLHQMILLGF